MNRQPTNQACFTRAMALFDAVNREDPNQDEGQPKELLYSQRMSEMLHRYAPMQMKRYSWPCVRNIFVAGACPAVIIR
jgi:hypothetical protein